MPCAGQEERIVADLYGELEAEEHESLLRHLAGCETCRREREDLGAARSYLQGARPAVPAAPRVVVLTTRASRLPSFAIAASLAAVGLLAGISVSFSWQAKRAAEMASLRNSRNATQDAIAELPTRTQIEALVDERLAHFRDEQEPRNASPVVAEPASRGLTRSELEDRLARMERKLDRSRADDVRYLLGEMEGVESRTGVQLGQTQEAIRYLALANDPRISER